MCLEIFSSRNFGNTFRNTKVSKRFDVFDGEEVKTVEFSFNNRIYYIATIVENSEYNGMWQVHLQNEERGYFARAEIALTETAFQC